MSKTRNRLVSRRTQAKLAARAIRSDAKRGGPVAKTAVKAAGKAAKGSGKAAKGGGPAAKVVGKAAGKATKRGGPLGAKALKAEGRRRARRSIQSGSRGSSGSRYAKRSGSGGSSGSRYVKYGLFVLAGLALGTLLGRRGASNGEDGSSSSFSGTTSDGSNYGGSAESTSGENVSGYQRPEDPNTTGSFREFSDPSAGPLIGGGRRPEMDIGTGQLEEVEQRIRSSIGEDERTRNLPRINVEVNGDVAELRGVAPSEETKESFGEIAAETDGVNEVRNLLTVDPSVSE